MTTEGPDSVVRGVVSSEGRGTSDKSIVSFPKKNLHQLSITKTSLETYRGVGQVLFTGSGILSDVLECTEKGVGKSRNWGEILMRRGLSETTSM